MKLNISEARKDFLKLPARLERETLVVYNRSNPAMIIMSPALFKKLIAASEALTLMHSALENAPEIKALQEEIANGLS